MKYIFSLILSLILVACETGNYPQAQPRLAPSQTVYRLNTGDTVKVTVFGENDLTGPYVIDSRGMLALPLMGKVDIADQTEQRFTLILCVIIYIMTNNKKDWDRAFISGLCLLYKPTNDFKSQTPNRHMRAEYSRAIVCTIHRNHRMHLNVSDKSCQV